MKVLSTCTLLFLLLGCSQPASLPEDFDASFSFFLPPEQQAPGAIPSMIYTPKISSR